MIAAEISTDLSCESSRQFTGLDSIILDCIDSLNVSQTEIAEVIGCDVLLSCLIYLLVKANIPDIPVYLSMISYFTLEHH